jgi:large subunit ribosomal protein L3
MAGHMGHERVTVKNLQVLRVDPEKNLVAVKGAVPGPRGGLVVLKKRAVG